MKLNIAAGSIALGAMLAPLAVSANADIDNPTPVLLAMQSVDTVPDYIEQEAITARIKSIYVKDRWVDGSHIHVAVDNGGAVRLSGTVASRREAERAMTLAQQVDGVSNVENRLRISKDVAY